MQKITKEAMLALAQMKCPRCGGLLNYRDVINESGLGTVISKEICELYCIYGHAYTVKMEDYIKTIGEDR